jgi:hypothetical protein
MNTHLIAVLRNFLNGKRALRFLATSILAGTVLAAGSAFAANKTRLSIYQHGKPVAYMPCQSQTLNPEVPFFWVGAWMCRVPLHS